MTGAVERAGVLEVSVRVARPDAACVRCGTFSSRVKEYRTCRVRDGLSYDRPTVLVWTKRRFRCETPGCVRSFTESTRQVAPRRRVRPGCARRSPSLLWTARRRRWRGRGWVGPRRRAIAAAARDKLARHPARPPRHLGIDETTFRRYSPASWTSTAPGCGTSSRAAPRKCWSGPRSARRECAQPRRW